MICCPPVALDGVSMVRFPLRVTRKSLPREASTAIVAASVRATTAGASAPGSMVVACPTAVAAEAGAAGACASTAPPAATPTAPLKMFLRLSVPCRPIVPVLSGSEPASREPDARRRVGNRPPNDVSLSLPVGTESIPLGIRRLGRRPGSHPTTHNLYHDQGWPAHMSPPTARAAP